METLPLLTRYTFDDGVVGGEVYGLRGVRDGTEIETNGVATCDVAMGFVVDDDGVVYELGESANADRGGFNFMIPEADVGGGLTPRPPNKANQDDSVRNLVKLTTAVLAGSELVNVLGHHLTVNMFWT